MLIARLSLLEPMCAMRRTSAVVAYTVIPRKSGERALRDSARFAQWIFCWPSILLVLTDQRGVRLRAADSYRHTAILTVAVKSVDQFSRIVSEPSRGQFWNPIDSMSCAHCAALPCTALHCIPAHCGFREHQYGSSSRHGIISLADSIGQIPSNVLIGPTGSLSIGSIHGRTPMTSMFQCS
jgi:hypothetical protein